MSKTILHIDMNAFFASVEQLTNPFIRDLPVAVVGGRYKNAALLAISYAAKKRGVPKLARLQDALTICPDLIAVPFDPLKYYSVNRRIVNIFRQYTPLVEVYSIDEAFLDITDVLHFHNGDPVKLAQKLKQQILDEVGPTLTSSVGISTNKLLAKIASNWQKPNGLTVIPWENRFEYLDKVPIPNIWGIGRSAGPKLTNVGVHSTAQVREMSDEVLRDMVGSYYTRLRMIANGEHFDPVTPHRSDNLRKSMQHAHTLGIPTSDKEELSGYVRKLSEKLARRLRRDGQRAQTVYFGIKPEKQGEYGWGSPTFFHNVIALDTPTNHGQDIFNAARDILYSFDLSQSRARLLVVGIHEFTPSAQMLLDMFASPIDEKVDAAVDEINSTYGEFTVRSGDITYNFAKESELSVQREDMTFHPAGGH